MAKFPLSFLLPDSNPHLSTLGSNSIAATFSGTSTASFTWFSANLAVYIPIRILNPMLINTLFWTNGSAVSGNVDMGIYSADGTRLTHTGSTAQAGTTAIQSVAVTAIDLTSGLYYLSLALDNATGAIKGYNIGSGQLGQVFGCAEQATAFALPATATFASYTRTRIPIMGATGRSFI